MEYTGARGCLLRLPSGGCLYRYAFPRKKQQEHFTVGRLACYDTPSDAAQAFQEEFGAAIPRWHVYVYDASRKHMRERLSQDLIAHFDETHARSGEETDAIGIAHKTYRL